MTRASERIFQPIGRNRAARPRSFDRALDAQRTASMADEGGCSGAFMDLREQLADAEGKPGERRQRALLERHAWWGAAGAVAGVIAGLLLGRLRAASR